MKKARLYDLETKTIVEVPMSELAPGYIQATVEGVEGNVFISADQVRRASRDHNYDFTEVMPLLRDLHERVQDVLPMSWDKWLSNFQADQDPEQEIAIWKDMVECFESLTEGRELSPQARRDYFALILYITTNGPDAALEVFRPVETSPEEAASIVAHFR